jgi:mannan endo-1,4-beta-mannosidase
MKRIIVLILVIAMVLSACSKNSSNTGDNASVTGDASVTGPSDVTGVGSDSSATPSADPAANLTYSKQTREISYEAKPFNTKLEAEDGIIEGKLTTGSSRSGYSGSGYVTNFNQAPGNKLAVTVEIPYSQFYDITVRAASDQYKINYLTADGVNICEIVCDGSTSKSFIDCTAESVYLEAGTVEFGVNESWGWFDLDSITIEAGEVVPAETYNGVSSKLANPNANEDAIKLMEYLVSIYGNYTLAGQYCTHNSSTEVEGILKATGKYPAVRGFDMIFCSPNSGYSDMNEISQAKSWASKGGIVSFSWHWHGPVGKNSFYSDTSDFRIPDARTAEDLSLVSAADLKAKYQNGEITEKQYKLISDIDVISFHLKNLRDAGIAILWRPLHEASGGWFWWGATGADDYIWLWKLMFNRMTYVHGLDNLIWVWNAQNADWYPGDEYVDIVGEDIYADAYDYGSQSAKFRSVLNYPDTPKLTTLSENGVIMDPELCARDNVWWLWFNVWNGDFLFDGMETNEKYTSDEMLRKAYNSEYVITLDELPWN